jgi:hypothetical protein
MRKCQSMTISTLGRLVLLVLIAVGIIIFIVVGIGTQAGIFNQTGTSIIGNLTEKAGEVSEGAVIK